MKKRVKNKKDSGKILTIALLFSFFVLILYLVILSIKQSKTTVTEAAPLRVIGGQSANKGEWPFTVFVWHYALGGIAKATCTGSLISPKWILTAKHCVSSDKKMKYTIKPSQLYITLNLHYFSDFKNKDNTELIFPKIKRVVPYEPQEFAKVTSECVKGLMCEFDVHDIALIELEESVDLPYVSLIDAYNYKKIVGKYGLVLGWGRTDFEAKELPNELQEGQVRIESFPSYRVRLDIEKYYKTYIASFYNDTKVAVQIGDSGGPLLFYNGSKYYLAGVSVGGDFISDPNNNWNIYKNVFEYLNWIENETGIRPGQGNFTGNAPYWITPTPKIKQYNRLNKR